VTDAIPSHGNPTAGRPGAGVPAAGPAVVCDQLVVRYGATVAVDRLSFTAEAGQVTALLGPNGAGKTSTVETLEGYRAAAAGTVRVLGLDPTADHAALVARMGVMLQRGGVYPTLGSAQVLHLFARYYDDAEDPDVLLERVGLDGVRSTPWRRLSGGEQQRLSLALALVGKPEVVFLDEPTAGVDPEGRTVVRGIIEDLRRRGVCVVLTTHELAEAERLADRVLIIAQGTKLAEDSPAGLAAGTADGSIRFTADAGLDTGALAGALGAGTTVEEERPGHYRVRPGTGAAVPDVVAGVAGWLAARGLALGDLRTGQSLEEAYLAITGSRGEPEATPDDPTTGTAGSRGRRHRTRRARP
jgi:ABC-2 type transport system ATP-binding protein